MFHTTHWSLVLAAGLENHPRREEAWDYLAREYWYPLYLFARRSGSNPENAADLTQGFFAKLLEGQLILVADPGRGKFRSLLLTAFRNFMGMKHRESLAQKRGGPLAVVSLDVHLAEAKYEVEPTDPFNPELLYERRWAMTLLQRAMDKLGSEYSSPSRRSLIEKLQFFLLGHQTPGGYIQAAQELGMKEGAVKVAVHRLRQRFRTLLRKEVERTVTSAHEVDEELRHIGEILRQ